MAKSSPIPIIAVEGNAKERGVQYGQQAKAQIEESLRIYKEFFEKAKLSWDDALKLGNKFLPFIQEFDPDSVKMIKGIAEGVKRSFEEIQLLNVRSEISYAIRTGGKVFEIGEEGCTTLAATPEVTLSGHMLIGQNVDWMPQTVDTYVLLKEKRDSAPNSLMLLEAGIVGRSTGLNSAGVARCGNGLFTDRIGLGVPVMIVERKQSTAQNIAEAMAIAVSPPPPQRAGSVNRAVADGSGLCVSIEVTPEDATFIWPDNGILVHTNHFLTPHTNVKDLAPTLFPGSLIKKYRADTLLTAERGKITVETMQRIFRDHAGKPASVCYHVGNVVTSQTVASIIIDVNDKKFFVAKGPPCESEYVPLSFDDIM